MHALTAWDVKFQVCLGYNFTPATLIQTCFLPDFAAARGGFDGEFDNKFGSSLLVDCESKIFNKKEKFKSLIFFKVCLIF
jgi:hypothetical protein